MKSKDIDLLLKLFSSLQGVGPRSASRIVLQLLKKKDALMLPLAHMIKLVAENIKVCEICGNYDDTSPCHICTADDRDKRQICVVEEVGDLWAMERGSFFKGNYHVLGGTLNAMNGNTPQKLNLDRFYSRLINENIKEVILATSITTAGQTTAHYLLSNIKKKDIKVTRLARGLPAGGELEYTDEATLGQALHERTLIFGDIHDE